MEILIERRKHQRFHITQGAFAGRYPNMGEIVDLSLGGIKFNYMGFAASDDEVGEFVVCGDDGCCLDNLPFEVVSDKVLANESSFSKMVTRQRRVKFKELTEEQEDLLYSFIINHKMV